MGSGIEIEEKGREQEHEQGQEQGVAVGASQLKLTVGEK